MATGHGPLGHRALHRAPPARHRRIVLHAGVRHRRPGGGPDGPCGAAWRRSSRRWSSARSWGRCRARSRAARLGFRLTYLIGALVLVISASLLQWGMPSPPPGAARGGREPADADPGHRHRGGPRPRGLVPGDVPGGGPPQRAARARRGHGRRGGGERSPDLRRRRGGGGGRPGGADPRRADLGAAPPGGAARGLVGRAGAARHHAVVLGLRRAARRAVPGDRSVLPADGGPGRAARRRRARSGSSTPRAWARASSVRWWPPRVLATGSPGLLYATLGAAGIATVLLLRRA